MTALLTQSFYNCTYSMMVNSVFFVQSTPLTLFNGSFQNIAYMLQTYLHLTFPKHCIYVTDIFTFDLSKTLHICYRHIYIGSFQSIAYMLQTYLHLIFPKHCIYVTDIFKMCMCKFDADFFFFFDKMACFLFSPFNNCTQSVIVNIAYFVKSTPLTTFVRSLENLAHI